MASITNQQNKLLSTTFLDGLGGDRNAMIEDVMAKYAKLFLDNAQNNINKMGIVSSGTLAKDLTFTINEREDVIELTVGYPPESKAAKYYDFVNKGVNGVENNMGLEYTFKSMGVGKKFQSSILQWLRTGRRAAMSEDQKNGLSKLQKKNKKLKKMLDENKRKQSLAYAIGVSIKRDGLKRRPFFDRAITQTFSGSFKRDVREALGKDIIITLKSSYGNNN